MLNGILLNNFISEKGLKYFLYYCDLKIFDKNHNNLSDIFEILLTKELIYLGCNIDIEGKIDINSQFICRMSLNITLDRDSLHIHLSNITSKKLRCGLGNELIRNFIDRIKEFNNKNLGYKFKVIEGYINPDESVIDLKGLISFYKKNGFKIHNLNNGIFFVYILSKKLHPQNHLPNPQLKIEDFLKKVYFFKIVI